MNKPIIIFDWDGTIADSNGFKWGKLWEETFKGDKEMQEIALRHLQTEEGRSLNRYQLIQKVLGESKDRSILDLSNDELLKSPVILEYANRFSDITNESISLIEPFENALDTLEELKGEGYKMYVITGGGTLNVRKQVEHLGLKDMFVDVLGNPKSKSDNFEKVAVKENTRNSNDYTVVGDGLSDLKLAEYIGCRFIGISNKWNGWKEDDLTYIKSVTLLRNVL